MTTAEIDNLQTQQDKDSVRIQVRHVHMHDLNGAHQRKDIKMVGRNRRSQPTAIILSRCSLFNDTRILLSYLGY